MKKGALVFSIIFSIFVFSTCSTVDSSPGGNVSSLEESRISALAALGRMEAAFSGPMYEGNGGEGITLAVFAPEAQGDVPAYLPLYIQNLLNNNFSKFTAVTIFDRQNLDRIITEQNIAAGGRFSDRDFISIGNLTNSRYLLFGSIQRLPGDNFSLRLWITDSTSGESRHDFMRDAPRTRLEGSGALINEATLDLLEQMGIRLSEAGRRSLLMGNMLAAQAEAGFARGIAAEAAGSQVEALLNFSQSIAFDHSQFEALSRLNILSTNISGGAIGQRILNDVEARNSWLEAFTETTGFFNAHPPFEITFDPNLVQEGEIDYMRRSPTVNIGMRIALTPSEAAFGALNALLEGLENTGRREPWGFSGWPLEDLRPRARGTVVFEGRRSFNFRVEAALLNETGRAISRSNITLSSGTINFSPGDTRVSVPDGDAGLMRFANVRAEDLTPSLTIVITAVNGIPSQRLSSTGYIRIVAGDLEQSYIFAGAGLPPLPSGRASLSPQVQAILAAREQELVALERRGSSITESREASALARELRTMEIVRAYSDLVRDRGDNATLFEVNGIFIPTNIYGQPMNGVKMLGLEMDGVVGYNSETDAVIFVSYMTPEFYSIRVGSRILLPAPSSAFEIIEGGQGIITGGNSMLNLFDEDGIFRAVHRAPATRGIRFRSGVTGLQRSEEQRDAGYKLTVVFEVLQGELGDIMGYPRIYRTRIRSFQPADIVRDIREAGARRVEYDSPYQFDFHPDVGMGINVINVSSILAVDGVPTSFIAMDRDGIETRARIRIQGMQHIEALRAFVARQQVQ